MVCGPSGTGKSFFLEAIGQAAVGVGIKVAWFALEDLGVLVRAHRADTPSRELSGASCDPSSSWSMTWGFCP